VKLGKNKKVELGGLPNNWVTARGTRPSSKLLVLDGLEKKEAKGGQRTPS